MKYNKLEHFSRRSRYLAVGNGNYLPVNQHDWLESLQITDELLHHFLTNHPNISNPPFENLNNLEIININAQAFNSINKNPFQTLLDRYLLT